MVASESVAIDTLNGKLIRNVGPGELVIFRGGEIESHQLYRETNSAHCVFEYVYFARPDSIIDGKLVYKVRERIGERLAREHPVEADMVSPVPDSGITSAIGYSRESDIIYEEESHGEPLHREDFYPAGPGNEGDCRAAQDEHYRREHPGQKDSSCR